jgi:hypothetical protein
VDLFQLNETGSINFCAVRLQIKSRIAFGLGLNAIREGDTTGLIREGEAFIAIVTTSESEDCNNPARGWAFKLLQQSLTAG